MGYKLGSRSLKNLYGVHHLLKEVVHSAIAITAVDFSVIEGLRTKQRHEQLYRPLS